MEIPFYDVRHGCLDDESYATRRDLATFGQVTKLILDPAYDELIKKKRMARFRLRLVVLFGTLLVVGGASVVFKRSVPVSVVPSFGPRPLYGPVIPPHLLRRAVPADDKVYGPRALFGPAIPPHLRRAVPKTTTNDEATESSNGDAKRILFKLILKVVEYLLHVLAVFTMKRLAYWWISKMAVLYMWAGRMVGVFI